MINTKEIYQERKREIEFYFSVLLDIDSEENSTINTIDNRLFFKIMKSNFLLMLYNIIEATITTGMLEIYEQVKNDKCYYSSLISELQNIWRDYRVKEIYISSSKLKSYIDRVDEIVSTVIHEVPLIFNKNMLNISGNLDAKQIKNICDVHRIRYRVSDDEMSLEKVKKKRNSLAHGEESFSDCARDFTVSDLENIKDKILNFLSEILEGMEKYYEEKQYLKH